MKTVRLLLPWWAHPYAYACVIFAFIHGVEADMDKITDRIVRNIKVKVV